MLCCELAGGCPFDPLREADVANVIDSRRSEPNGHPQQMPGSRQEVERTWSAPSWKAGLSKAEGASSGSGAVALPASWSVRIQPLFAAVQQTLAEDLVLPIASAYLTEIPQIESATIQYVDRFLASPNERDIDWSELFRPDTSWVVGAMRHTTTAWHSHCGCFEATGDSGRRLVNVNVDVREPTSRPGAAPIWSLAILTLCSHHFSRPGVPTEPVTVDAFPSEMRARFDELHDRAKDILREVLADPYVEAIGMGKKGA